MLIRLLLHLIKHRDKTEVIKKCCLCYARKAVGSTCISNNELRSHCNIVRVEQLILALADS